MLNSYKTVGILFTLLLSVKLSAVGQLFSKFSNDEVKHDTTYVIDYSDQLAIKLQSTVRSNEVKLYDNFTKQEFNYKPNESFGIGFEANYKWMGLTLNLNIPVLNNDDDRFGKTKHIDLQYNIYMTQLVVDLIYQKYSGYYASNQQDYDDTFDPENPISTKRRDLNTSNYGMTAFYIFNSERFSYRSAFTFNERQIKSSGSVIAGIYSNYYTLNADSTLIPSSYQELVNPDIDLIDTKYYTFGGSFGYAYNLVIFKRVFLSTSLSLGFGPQFHKQTDDSDLKTTMSSFVAVRGAIGYNSKVFFMGVSLFGLSNGNRNEEQAHLSRSVNNIKNHIGKRFSINR